MSWELSDKGRFSERGDVEGISYQDLDNSSSQFVRTEAEGPIDVDPVYPEEAFGNLERVGLTGCFGPCSQGGLVGVLPITTPSRPISGSTVDSGS